MIPRTKGNRLRVRVIRRGKYYRLRGYMSGNSDAILWERTSRAPRNREESKREARAIELGEEAIRVAREREDTRGTVHMTLGEVLEVYEERHISRTSKSNRAQYSAMCGALRQLRLDRVDEIRLYHVDEMIDFWESRNLSPATISSYCKTLRAFLNWTYRRDFWTPGTQPPVFQIKGGRARKRPVTHEEYQAMQRRVIPANRWLFDVLWYSNLRIGEINQVVWEPPGAIWIDWEAEEPIWRVDTQNGKLGKYNQFPVPPDFVDWLRSYWTRSSPNDMYMFPHQGNYSQIVRRAARRAGVITGRDTNDKPLYAGAHDFRRAFATRWASLLTPADLMVWMRHKSIATTLTFYVDLDSAKLAGRARAAMEAQEKTILEKSE